MKYQHSRKFYEQWLRTNYLTTSDASNYIRSYEGKAIEPHKIIDFMVKQNYSASDLKYITNR